MRITIFDYGCGNLHSLTMAVTRLGHSPQLTPRPDLAECECLLLPGVGNYAAAAQVMASSRPRILAAVAAGLPVVGICLGMQLLFEESDEGPGEGLGLLEGRVTRMRAATLPHIGWNSLESVSPDFPALSQGYYANGFACRPVDESLVKSWTTHQEDRFPAVVARDRIAGVQCHPEKSSRPGLRFLDQLLTRVAS